MKMTKVLSLVAVATFAAAILNGCAGRGATLHPHSASKIMLTAQDAKLTKIAEGKNCEPVILNMQFTAPSFYDAQQSALESAGAEILLDEVSYEALENAIALPNPLYGLFGGNPWLFLIYGDHCEVVSGYGVNRR
ncbi:MAG: hypothetical protein KC466_03985 [Myxococcales bacterium]|nr:hypothetical protein [Myxococcales bacterium]